MPRIITLQGVKAIDETIKRTILEVLDRHRITAPMLAVQLACSQRAAASALSSGRELKAMTAPGAALCTALITASNIDRLRGGSRMPAPITTQS